MYPTSVLPDGGNVMCIDQGRGGCPLGPLYNLGGARMMRAEDEATQLARAAAASAEMAK